MNSNGPVSKDVYGHYVLSSQNQAVGAFAKATGNAAAYGLAARAFGNSSVAIGPLALAGGDQSKIVNATTINTNDVSEATVKSQFASYLTAIGYDSLNSTTQLSIMNDLKEVIAINQLKGIASTAVGYNANAKEAYSLSLGANTVAGSSFSVALGTNSVVYRPWSDLTPQYGQNISKSQLWGSVSVGGNGMLRQIINVAEGTEDTDAVNVRQLRFLEAKLANTTGGTTSGNSDISYKANDSSVPFKVNSAEGFNFKDGENTHVVVSPNGGVQYNINKDLTNITSISGNGTSVSMQPDSIQLNNKKLQG